MNQDAWLLWNINTLSSAFVDLMAALDEAVDNGITDVARSLARSARETSEYLVANVELLGNQEATERARRMAAQAAQLDRDINGGTLLQ